MITEIMQLAISNGLWAVLFVFLFVYQLKDSNKREKQYISIINQLSGSCAILKKVDLNLQDVSKNVLGVKKMLLKKGVTSGN